jgi:hypothetical protein
MEVKYSTKSIDYNISIGINIYPANSTICIVIKLWSCGTLMESIILAEKTYWCRFSSGWHTGPDCSCP